MITLEGEEHSRDKKSVRVWANVNVKTNTNYTLTPKPYTLY
jgi:hypothetical protein